VVCRQADWHDRDDRAAIEAEGSYDVIVINPPYPVEGTPLFDGYESCPPEAVYSDSIDGMLQCLTVLPWLASMLSDAEGAAMIVRRPFSSDAFRYETGTMVANAVLANIPRQPGEQDDFGIVNQFIYGTSLTNLQGL
jgi:hypothetical protein